MKFTRAAKVRIASLAVVAAAGVGGAAMLSQTASAASTTVAAAATTATPSAAATAAPDPSLGGHVGSNGVTEVLLTGDAATKATAAALAAVPGGTIERVENDAEGATYEAHMIAADGSHVTVKMDASFTVTSTEAGH